MILYVSYFNIGSHFTALGDDQSPQPQASSSSGGVQITSPGGADMSVRSSTNPNQATDADHRKMQEILADPEIADILIDPRIQAMFEVLRKDPDNAQRLDMHDLNYHEISLFTHCSFT